MNKRFETIQSKRLTITAFDMKYLDDYYHNFDKEITQYQYPDPFDSLESARKCLQEFIDAAARGEMLFLALLDSNATFIGSLEVHGLMEETPELGIWIARRNREKAMRMKRWRVCWQTSNRPSRIHGMSTRRICAMNQV